MDSLMMGSSFKIESHSSFVAITYKIAIMLSSHQKEIRSESEKLVLHPP